MPTEDTLARARAIFNQFFGESLFSPEDLNQIQGGIVALIEQGLTDDQVLQTLAVQNPTAAAGRTAADAGTVADAVNQTTLPGGGGTTVSGSDFTSDESTASAPTSSTSIFGGTERDPIGFDDQGNLVERTADGRIFVNGVERQGGLTNSNTRAQFEQATRNGIPSGSGTGTGGLSPNVTAQITSSEKTFFADLAQDAEQFAQQLQLQTASLEEQIRQANQSFSLSLSQLEIDKDRLALQDVQGRRDDALNLTALVANQENQVNDQKIQLTSLSTQAKQFNADLQAKFQQFRASMEAQIATFNSGQALQADQFNATAQQRAGEFNASARQRAGEFNASQQQQRNLANANLQQQTALANADRQTQVAITNAQNELTAALATANQAFEAAQASADRVVNLAVATDQALAKNIDQQIQIAAQIADFQRDPGDIVANIAALDQFGSISEAISGGFTAITEESLQPLQTSINAQGSAQTEEGRLRERASTLRGLFSQALDPSLGVQQIDAPTAQAATTTAPTVAGVDAVAAQTVQAPDAVQAQQVGTPQTTAPGAIPSDFDALAASLGQTDVTSVFNNILGSLPLAEISETDVNTALAELGSIATGGLLNTTPEAGSTTSPILAEGGGATRFETQPTAAPEDTQIVGTSLVPVAQPLTFEEALAQTQTTGVARAQEGATQEELMALIRAGLEGFEHGGTTTSPIRLVGEDGPEIEIQNPDGSVTIIPNDQITEAQDGGLFNNPPLTDTTDARALLQDAFRKAAERFRLAAPNIPVGPGGIPSPIQVSAPGTSKFIQDAAAGLAQSGRGIKKSVFNEELARVRPQGVQQGVTRRTA